MPSEAKKNIFRKRNNKKMKTIDLFDNYINGKLGPEEITEFINQYVDKEKTFDSTFLNKLQGLYDDLKWSFPSLNEYANKFFVIS
jgi:hypothetical protein